MKKNVAKKWIKALRSGKYKQCKSTLKTYNSKGQPQHCCLGVLCELYNQDMKKNKKKTLSEKTLHHPNHLYGVAEFNSNRDHLPKKVVDWAGMNDNVGGFGDKSNYNRWNCLSDLNDNGKTFKTIANIIEKNMENI